MRFAMLTKPGSRTNNEDAIGMIEENGRYCFVLADGLGGHGKGEVASEIAVKTAVQTFVEAKGEEGCLDLMFEKAQEAIEQRQKEDRAASDAKTTAVMLTAGRGEAAWGHVGDSRLYYFHKKKIRLRTLDHSVPQMLVAAGEIREKQIRRHPDRNRLLRVMGGAKEQMRYELGRIQTEHGDCFLLCSDGFWELIEEKKMESALKRAENVDAWMERMTQVVEKNGAGRDMDNYSAIAVWVE